MSKPNGKLTRTQRDPKYRQVNRNAMSRNDFYVRSAWRWIRANLPDVAAIIRAEGQKRWPSPIQKKARNDYSYLDEVQPQAAKR